MAPHSWLPRVEADGLRPGDDPDDPRVRYVIPDFSDPRVRRVRPDFSDPRVQEVVLDRTDTRLRYVDDPLEGFGGILDAEDEAGAGKATAGTGGSTLPRFGLNRIQSYLENPAFGIGNDSLLDAVALGAETVRMVGHGDLQWAALAAASTQLHELVGQEVPLDPGDILLGVPDNLDALVGTLKVLDSAGVGMVALFLGEGGSGPKLSDVLPAPPALTTGLAEVDGFRAVRETLDNGTVARLRWSEDHAGQYSPLLSEPFPAPVSGSDDSDYNWDFESLDVTSPYKREFLYHLAQASIGALKQATDLAGVTDRVSELVEAIETLNEVDVANRFDPKKVPSPVTDAGEYWGRAYLHAAWGLRQALETEFPVDGANVRLKLPSTASYQSGVNGFTWDDKLDFWGAFAQGFVDEIDRLAGEQYESDGLDFDRIADLFQGIDYHWYHRNTDTGSQLTHAGMLVHEVGELRQALLDGLTTGLSAVLPATEDPEDYLPDLPVSIYENGTSRTDEFPSTLSLGAGWPPGGSSFGPPTPSVTTTDPLENQARDLIRRLGAGLASGAEVVGWHAWMDLGAGEFAGTGLRDDLNLPGFPTLSEQRLAWHVYQRLSELLGGGRVRTGQMIWPDTTASDELTTRLEAGEAKDGALVFEYFLRGTTGPTHAYLVMVDPTVTSAVEVLYGTLSGTRGAVSLVPLRPAHIPALSLPSSTGPGSVLLYRDMPFPPAQTVTLPRFETLDWADWPQLILAHERLEFQVS